jgi:hypothetical protein
MASYGIGGYRRERSHGKIKSKREERGQADSFSINPLSQELIHSYQIPSIPGD